MSFISSIDLGLTDKLRDKRFRKKFFKATAQEGIASQIRFMREMRNMRQKDLAEAADMKQSAISRLEQADYSSWNLGTLLRLGEALDARVSVLIEPYEDVIRRLQGDGTGIYGIIKNAIVYLTESTMMTDVTDHSKLDIRDGAIHCFIYQQDGSKQAMKFIDNRFNRDFISWLQIHDQ